MSENGFDLAWQQFRDAEDSGDVRKLAIGLQWLTDAIEEHLNQ